MADRQDYPPVALGRLDDESRWHWLDGKPSGCFDWALTLLLAAVACIPFLLVYVPITWALRTILRKVGA